LIQFKQQNELHFIRGTALKRENRKVTRLFSLAQKSHCDATVFFGTKITL
jgi:hypothetical protein